MDEMVSFPANGHTCSGYLAQAEQAEDVAAPRVVAIEHRLPPVRKE
jgi:hypothetical protein